MIGIYHLSAGVSNIGERFILLYMYLKMNEDKGEWKTNEFEDEASFSK